MARIHDKIRQNVQRLLQPGEEVEVVIPAQTRSGWLTTGIGLIGMLFTEHRPIIVTDRRIVLAQGGRWSGANPKSIVAEIPRTTTFGEPSGVFWRTEVFGQKLYVARAFHKDVRQADALRPS